MSEIDYNVAVPYGVEIQNWPTGNLTKREYFAGLAMQGLLANPSLDMESDALVEKAVLAAENLLRELGETEE